MTYPSSGLRQLQNDIMGGTRVVLDDLIAHNTPIPSGTPMLRGARKGDWPDYNLIRIYSQLMNSAQPTHRI